jgi:hypothetical protein
MKFVNFQTVRLEEQTSPGLTLTVAYPKGSCLSKLESVTRHGLNTTANPSLIANHDPWIRLMIYQSCETHIRAEWKRSGTIRSSPDFPYWLIICSFFWSVRPRGFIAKKLFE